MALKNVPIGYTVVYIEGRWYPLKVDRHYSIQDPDGYPCFCPLFSYSQMEVLSFSTQREAVLKCQAEAQEKETQERERWERLTIKSDVYPERCAHYMDIIEQVCGRAPIVTRFTYAMQEVSVMVHTDDCSHCRTFGNFVSVIALTIEDALVEVAERVYAERCLCEHVQDERLQLIA